MIQKTDFMRVKNDVNGNPRYVCHFLCLDVHGLESDFTISERYAMACKLANRAGGRKFHNKQYGGGIVFQSYCLNELCNFLNNLMEKQGVTA